MKIIDEINEFLIDLCERMNKQNTSAEEMFNELNYKIEDLGDYIRAKLNDERCIYYIDFNKKYKVIDTNMNEEIDMPMLQAIIQMCCELGWLD